MLAPVFGAPVRAASGLARALLGRAAVEGRQPTSARPALLYIALGGHAQNQRGGGEGAPVRLARALLGGAAVEGRLGRQFTPPPLPPFAAERGRARTSGPWKDDLVHTPPPPLPFNGGAPVRLARALLGRAAVERRLGRHRGAAVEGHAPGPRADLRWGGGEGRGGRIHGHGQSLL